MLKFFSSFIVLSQVANFDCPSCECKGTVMFITAANDLRRQKAAFDAKFEKRMKEYTKGDEITKKPCQTKYPQQQ
jgi:hypothetical protein